VIKTCVESLIPWRGGKAGERVLHAREAGNGLRNPTARLESRYIRIYGNPVYLSQGLRACPSLLLHKIQPFVADQQKCQADVPH